MEEEKKEYKKGRVYFGGLSKQRRRNEPLGNLGNPKIYILEDKETKEIRWRKTDKDEKNSLEEKFKILATYYSDDKGMIKLPNCMKEDHARWL